MLRMPGIAPSLQLTKPPPARPYGRLMFERQLAALARPRPRPRRFAPALVITDFHASNPAPRPGDTLSFEGWLMSDLGGGRCVPLPGRCVHIGAGWVKCGMLDDIVWKGCQDGRPGIYHPAMSTDARGRFASPVFTWDASWTNCALVQALFFDRSTQPWTVLASSPLMRVGTFSPSDPECPLPGPSLPVSLCARLPVEPPSPV